MLNYEFPPLGGGAANATKHILQEFSNHDDIEIDLVTSSVSKHKIEIFSENITIHYLDIGKNNEMHNQSNKDLLMYSYKAYNYSKKLLKEKDHELIHAFFGIPCGYIAKNLNKPYIVSLRGSDVPFYSEKYKLLDTLFFERMSRDIWRRAEHVVANSSGLKDLALKTSAEQDIKLIFNGVDINKFKAKDDYFIKDKFQIISVGRLIKRKGYNYLIEALEGLDNVKLILCGEGPLRQELQLLAKEKGVEVEFRGNVSHDDLVPMLRESDLFVLPSLNEGMSNTVLEAMACGLPLVVSNVGGMSELVDNNGHMFEIGEWGKLKEFIEKMIEDHDHRISCGRRSCEMAKDMSWEKVSYDYKKIYESVGK